MKWGIATAATASFVPTCRPSTGVTRLPIPNPVTAAMAAARSAVTARRRVNIGVSSF
jgi:alkanesulfonate monooxygenase SsuD/methylene tetrahydromethanopterin reductase-like flavin-dependent oxidoreductase (luciferase family)